MYTLLELDATSTITTPDVGAAPGPSSRGIMRVGVQEGGEEFEAIARQAFSNYLEDAAIGPMFDNILKPYGSPERYVVVYHIHAAFMPAVEAEESSIVRMSFRMTEKRRAQE